MLLNPLDEKLRGIKMANIKELLLQAKQLKEKQKALNAEMKQKKSTIAKEYQDGLSEADKNQQIKDAEKILSDVKIMKDKLRLEFRQKISELKVKVSLAKDILAFVNYKNTHTLGKVKNAYVVDDKTATFKRAGLQDITFNIVNGWEKNLKTALKKQGINGDDRVADNIVYKMQMAIKTHNAS